MKILSRLLVAASLTAALVAPAHAATPCAAAHDIAITIAKARDRGVALTQAMNAAQQGEIAGQDAFNQWLRDVVELIYAYPELTPKQIGVETLRGCMKGRKEVTNRGGV